MNIQTVKLQQDGWLVNGTMSVPDNPSNRHYHEVQEWLKTNTPEPGFTQAELDAKALQEKQAELAATDSNMARVTEDLIDVLLSKNLLLESDLPIAVREKLTERKTKRSQL